MTPLFTKPLSELDQPDVEKLLLDEIPEGQHVEYKQRLPAKGESVDPWYSGAGRIGDRARNEILEEIVAFANSEGGNLIVGVKQTEDKPPRPDGIDPLPNCHDLAERFGHIVRDCVEPEIPVFEIAGVSTKKDGAGIVLIRVASSRSAPHRVTTTNNCTIRRADRTEVMGMREIQDRTIELARGDERLRERLEERRENYFKNRFGHGPSKPVAGVRVTLIPVRTNIQIHRPFDQPELSFYWESIFQGKVSGKRAQFDQPGRMEGANPLRPVLRGALDRNILDNSTAWRWISAEGMVEIGFRYVGTESVMPILYPNHLLATVANVLRTGDSVRSIAGVPAAEFALDVELRCDNIGPGAMASSPLQVASLWYGEPLGGDPFGILDEALPLRFPLCSVGGHIEFDDVVTSVLDDLLNTLGHRSMGQVEINWPVAS